jgi:hypothetical protein
MAMGRAANGTSKSARFRATRPDQVQKHRAAARDQHARARISAKPRVCAWCNKEYPSVRYGPRVFCSATCRKASQKDRQLQTKYGITLADYQEMLARQDNRCALCRRKSRFSLAVEHSHITGTVRGAACMTCNRDILGPLDGDLEKFDAAIAFLQLARDDLASFLDAHPELKGVPAKDLPTPY